MNGKIGIETVIDLCRARGESWRVLERIFELEDVLRPLLKEEGPET